MNSINRGNPSSDKSTQRWRLSLIASLVLISIGWLMFYRTHPAAPGPIGSHPTLGWWGWFDQGQYLKITNQFANGDWFNPDKYYPPLYPAIPATLSRIIGDNSAYLLIDLGLCLTFFSGLFIHFKQYLNPIASLISISLMYGLTSIAYEQWVIPWTTNLSSTLLIVISLLLNFDYAGRKNHQAGTKNRVIIAFFLTALLIWVRPFEIIPATILCAGFIALQLKSIVANHKTRGYISAIKRLAGFFTVPCITFAGTIGLYVIYNIRTFGSWEPSYSKSINSMGFSPLDLGFKFVSLTIDSSVYGINDGHLSHALPLFIPLAALSLLGLFILRLPLKILVLAAFTNFISYLSFNDLVPTGLFTFNNIHYFTWSLAVISVSAVAALSAITQKSIRDKSFRQLTLPILAGFWVFLSIAATHTRLQTNFIGVTTSAPMIKCQAEIDPTSNVRGKAAVFYFEARQSTYGKARMLNVNIETSSTPTQVHLAHQDQIDLNLNGSKLAYRKHWRLVNHNTEKGNNLTILLHKAIPTNDITGTITIGQNSNITLNNVDFSQKKCEVTRM